MSTECVQLNYFSDGGRIKYVKEKSETFLSDSQYRAVRNAIYYTMLNITILKSRPLWSESRKKLIYNSTNIWNRKNIKTLKIDIMILKIEHFDQIRKLLCRKQATIPTFNFEGKFVYK